jgi:N-acetylglutamate synthase
MPPEIILNWPISTLSPANAPSDHSAEPTLDLLRRRVEEASLSAWPAIDQILVDGWVVRLSNGYTKRANSVVPLYPSLGRYLWIQVERCEHIYASRGLPPIFRLVDFCAPEGLDALLEQRGFQRLDGTHVLCRELEHAPPVPLESMVVVRQPLDTWLGDYASASELDLEKNLIHRQILERISADVGYFSLYSSQDELLATGLAVHDGSFVGLFDIVTPAAYRRRGFATILIEAMLGWGHGKGATTAYLQVVTANDPARQLYRKLGFTGLYHYWYRVPAAFQQ